MSYGVHWFRRDLRVAGNKALRHNFKKNEGKVLCFFTFDKKFLSREDFSVNRFQFFLNTLKALREEIRLLGGELIILDVGPEEAFSEFIDKNKSNLPSLVTWSRDYEPFAVKRDKKLTKLFNNHGIETKHFRDHLIIEPHELYRGKPDEGYQIYTPFSKKWNKIIQEPDFAKRIKEQKLVFDYLEKDKEKIFDLSPLKSIVKNLPTEILDDYIAENLKAVTVDIPEAGFEVACEKLFAFKKYVDEYSDKRDFPNLKATSGLSVFLKNGTLTAAQIIYALGLRPYEKKSSSKDVFLSELIWREFYYHILFRKPSVEKEEFNQKYSSLNWQNDKKWFKAWQEGRTGFPIVDAGMRQLKKTGLMHNRVRMIVASFLTKDLLIDWRWGEEHFMKELLDGDLAPNNGGWQWAASTGCDAQPYFRVFNPFLQSKRFDPSGEYIKEFVPELIDVESKRLHEPILGHSSYPEPIVEHSVQRDKAIAMYKEKR